MCLPLVQLLFFLSERPLADSRQSFLIEVLFLIGCFLAHYTTLSMDSFEGTFRRFGTDLIG